MDTTTSVISDQRHGDTHDEHEIHDGKALFKLLWTSGRSPGQSLASSGSISISEVVRMNFLQGFQTAVAGARGAYGIQKKLVAIVEKRSLLNGLEVAAYQDMTLIASAVCQALVAAQIHKRPDDVDVQRFMEELLDDPRARSRLFRLFVEGAKSPDNNRKAILAAALIHPGVSDVAIQDRVDSALERLFVDDIRLAAAIRRLIPYNEYGYLADGEGLLFIGKHPLSDPPDLAGWVELSKQGIDRPSLYALNGLQQAGCIQQGSQIGIGQIGINIYQSNITVSVLGCAVLESIEAASSELLMGATFMRPTS